MGPRPPRDLTNRKVEVLVLLQRRLLKKEMASRLGITGATVKTHALNLYQKLGVHNRRPPVVESIRLKILAGLRARAAVLLAAWEVQVAAQP